MCGTQKALNPVTWVEAQAVLQKLGYDLLSHNRKDGTASFRLRSGVRTEGKKNPLTIAHPDFVAADGFTPAYERDYFVDLLTQAIGGNGGKPIVTIFADLDSPDRV